MRYVICSPGFDPNSGGTIFLHRLAHELNAMGEEAVLHPIEHDWIRPPPSLKERLMRLVGRKPEVQETFIVNPGFDTPVERTPSLDPDTVVL